MKELVGTCCKFCGKKQVWAIDPISLNWEEGQKEFKKVGCLPVLLGLLLGVVFAMALPFFTGEEHEIAFYFLGALSLIGGVVISRILKNRRNKMIRKKLAEEPNDPDKCPVLDLQGLDLSDI